MNVLSVGLFFSLHRQNVPQLVALKLRRRESSPTAGARIESRPIPEASGLSRGDFGRANHAVDRHAFDQQPDDLLGVVQRGVHAVQDVLMRLTNRLGALLAAEATKSVAVLSESETFGQMWQLTLTLTFLQVRATLEGVQHFLWLRPEVGPAGS
jgi:hypothetical protein